MNDGLYDTSWTLYSVSNAKASYRDLVFAEPASLDRRARQFSDFLTINRPTYTDDSENEKNGGLRECTWTTVINPEDGAHKETRSGILISLIYDKATYKFILYGGLREGLPLLLAKAPAATVKRFTSFLTDTFHANVNLLKLPPSMLQNALQPYLSNLHHASKIDTTSSASLLRTILGNLKITLTFSAPIAPHLKTLDLDIPPETVDTFMDEQTNGNTRASSSKTLLSIIAEHLHNATGLKIPITSNKDVPNGGNSTNGHEEEDAIMSISKITCAAFAISVEGRLKFASKVIEAAVQLDDMVRKSNEEMLESIVKEAAQRAEGG